MQSLNVIEWVLGAPQDAMGQIKLLKDRIEKATGK